MDPRSVIQIQYTTVENLFYNFEEVLELMRKFASDQFSIFFDNFSDFFKKSSLWKQKMTN